MNDDKFYHFISGATSILGFIIGDLIYFGFTKHSIIFGNVLKYFGG